MLVMLAHSLVDYPLRTPALMMVAGLLAGTAAVLALREPHASEADDTTIGERNSRAAAIAH
ncbi:hypothetical protein H1235_00650 [Pseudoxanthomonas sp. NC8]|nr:hypothetical protein H1235_00650 [Pseudoxanthomonas sp. NC8]